jgi:hypothetical protein
VYACTTKQYKCFARMNLMGRSSSIRLSTEYTDAILIDPQTWRLPAGAHGENGPM